jgi:hypothetical protein
MEGGCSGDSSERPRRVEVVTLSTEEGPPEANWMHGAKRLGYSVTALGRGEKWGGWPWRTKEYIRAIETLPPDVLVLVVDMGDVLLCRGPKSLLRAYDSIGAPLVFGGEPTCCVGNFSAIRMNGERQRAMTTIDGRAPRNRWKFPNAGCIMGTREAVLNALHGVRDEPDDQAGHLARYLDDPAYLAIDWQHSIVGNVNKPGALFSVDTSLLADKDGVELQHWERVRVWDLGEELRRKGEDASAYADSIGPTLYRNRTTGGVPCVLHFPGKNVRGYNLLGAGLYGTAFRPVKVENPPSVGKAALLSIAGLWNS